MTGCMVAGSGKESREESGKERGKESRKGSRDNSSMTVFSSILVVLSISGVILNNHKRIECFYIWMFTNASWFIVDLYYGIYPQAVLFFVYFILAVHGLITWRKKGRVDRKGESINR